MKILFWTYAYWPKLGGLTTFGTQTTKELTNRGHECVVIARQSSSSWPQYEEHESTPIHRFPFEQAYIKNDLKTLGEILLGCKKVFKEFQPDLIHINTGFGPHLLILNMLLKNYAIPTITTIHGLHPTEELKARLDIEDVFKNSFNLSERLICVSKDLEKHVHEISPSQSNKTTCILNGLIEPPLTPSPLSLSPCKLLCFGRLDKEKGFDLAIKALAELKEQNVDAELSIAGSGIDETYLRSLTESLNLEKKVKFLGKVDHENIYSVINDASIVLMPSRYEPFGLSALEALQMARPTIASNLGGLKEVIQNNKTGLLVEPNNPGAISNAILSLINNPASALQMAQDARVDALTRFSIKNMVDAYENEFYNLLKQKQEAYAEA